LDGLRKRAWRRRVLASSGHRETRLSRDVGTRHY
jgi:hypothetical protein